MINQERIADTFKMLVEIGSVSKNERDVSRKIEAILTEMGASVARDTAGDRIGGNCGNLYAYFKGTSDAKPLLLNAHMDTVEPGNGIRAVLKDGIFTSAGDTILGADDKSAIAILIEAMRTVLENDLPHPPVELVFTVAEEIGLLGAKNMEMDRITATEGYALDTSGTDNIITGAPGANRFEITVNGKEAHAGVAPEDGINAIAVAADAIAGLQLGRIDPETTCNIGTINGGTATNIIPNSVVLHGEVRSHNPEKLEAVTTRIIDAFRASAEKFRPDASSSLPDVDISLEKDFSATHIPDDHLIVRMVRKAGENLDRTIKTGISGGGSDANLFFEKGIIVGILGTGMTDVHTVNESIAVADMVRTAGLVVELLKLYAAAPR